MNIGLTGGIACGKSTVAGMLVARGALLIDADLLAREVVLPGTPALARVAERFGSGVLLPDGSLDRKGLGSLIFGDNTARKDLEEILHPAIRSLMRARMRMYETDEPDKLVVTDIPLLFESGLESLFHEVMVVYIPRELQKIRLMNRDGLTDEEAELRLSAQMPIEEKRRRADVLIRNHGGLDATERQVEAFWRKKGLS